MTKTEIENNTIAGQHIKGDSNPIAIVANKSKAGLVTQVKEKGIRFIHQEGVQKKEYPLAHLLPRKTVALTQNRRFELLTPSRIFLKKVKFLKKKTA